jgi:hypothetical protein
MLSRRQHRHVRRPRVEGLEARSLLSTMGSSMPHAPSAQVHIEKTHKMPRNTNIVGHLTATPQLTATTIPSNGDVNPYGVAFVPNGFAKGGTIRPGDVLVANFNNSNNVQGTGTTIVRISPQGNTSTFFQGTAPLGLDTALGVLKRGFVIVGNIPTTDGTGATAQQGSLLILDKNGNTVTTLTDANMLNGPWDLTVNDQGAHAQIFVSSILSGTVTRIDLSVPNKGTNITVQDMVQIGSGYQEMIPGFLGVAGTAYDAKHDILYVVSSAEDSVFVIAHAGHTRADNGTGALVYHDDVHLHGPIGLALTPNGNLITANADGFNADPNQNSELVEFTTRGQFVAQYSLAPTMPAAPFNIALSNNGKTTTLVAVNDDTNQLEFFTVATPQ